MDFYIPQYRWQYIEWLSKRYPGGKFKHMGLKQLQAIYLTVRRQNG